jgi:hypothetical protein
MILQEFDNSPIGRYTGRMSLPRLSEDAIESVSVQFCASLERLAPALLPPARRLLSRIAAPNWTLEWSLPVWLGDAFGLPPETSAGSVLANAYGLAFVRLIDDLADGEGAELQQAEAVLLAGALHSLWVAQLQEVIGGRRTLAACGKVAPRFWPRFHRYRSQWRQALLDDRLPPTHFSAYTETDLRRLAARGAPLKVCCAAACLLGGREGDLPALEAAIDHLLAGAVLLDHAQDWRQDLTEGRANAFVAHFSDLPQVAEHREANRRAVLEGILLGDSGRPYFARIGALLRAAGETAQALRCAGLAAFLSWLERETDAYAARLRTEAQAQLGAAVRAFMGPPIQVNGQSSRGGSYGNPGTDRKTDRKSFDQPRVPHSASAGSPGGGAAAPLQAG